MKIANTTLKRELEILRATSPEIYRRFFSKIYNHDPAFHDWRFPLYAMAKAVIAFLTSPRPSELPEVVQYEMQIAHYMQLHGNPLFFVGRDLFNACRRTDRLENIVISEMKLPHEAFTFVLPTDVLTWQNQSVNFISVFRQPKGEITYYHSRRPFTVEAADTALVISAVMPSPYQSLTLRITDTYINDLDNIPYEEQWTDKNFSLITRPDGSIEETDIDIDFSQYRRFGKKVKPTMQDIDFTRALVNIALNLLTATEVRPDIVIQERKIKHLRRDRQTELWSPNFIGKHYRTQLATNSEIEAGHHNSPRTHWRRGHFRRQGIGHRTSNCACSCPINRHDKSNGFCYTPDCKCTGLRRVAPVFDDYKIIWIEPMLVMASVA